MEFLGLFALIEKHMPELTDGVPTWLIASVLTLLAMMSLISWSLKKFKELRGLIIELRPEVKDRTRYNSDLMMQSMVVTSLQAILEDYYGDRVLLADYHNGEFSLGGKSMLKVTVTHEVISNETIGVVSPDIQSQTAAMWSSWNYELAQNRPVLIPDTEELKKSAPHLYLFVAVQHQVKSIYLFPMFTPQGVLDGVGVLEFCREKVDLSSDELALLANRFSAVEGMLISTNHATCNMEESNA